MGERCSCTATRRVVVGAEHDGLALAVGLAGRRAVSTVVSTEWVKTAPPGNDCTCRSVDVHETTRQPLADPLGPEPLVGGAVVEPRGLGVEHERRVGRERREVAVAVGRGEGVDDGGCRGLDLVAGGGSGMTSRGSFADGDRVWGFMGWGLLATGSRAAPWR